MEGIGRLKHMRAVHTPLYTPVAIQSRWKDKLHHGTTTCQLGQYPAFHSITVLDGNTVDLKGVIFKLTQGKGDNPCATGIPALDGRDYIDVDASFVKTKKNVLASANSVYRKHNRTTPTDTGTTIAHFLIFLWNMLEPKANAL